MLKGEQKLTIKIEGRGPIGVILVDSNAKGEVRGYVTNPQTHFDLKSAWEIRCSTCCTGTDGTLSVVKDIGMRDQFNGPSTYCIGRIRKRFHAIIL